MEEARGGIHVRSPGAAKFGWTIVPASDVTCLRDHVSRTHHPHGFHCLSPLPANVRLPDGMSCQTQGVCQPHISLLEPRED
jgi:hypothetical protein